MFFDNRADYEITCKNIVEPGRTQMTIWRMRFTCRITKTTDTLRISYLLLFRDNNA